MLSKNFVLKDLGIVKECLGMSVNFDKQNCTITLSQEKYIDKLLSKFGLKYSKSKNVNIEGYVDADWSNDINDRRSYSGFCFTLSGSVISWSCSKQKCIALSSTEAEYVSISEACKEAVYLRNLQYEITKSMYKITLYNDSMSAQKLLLNPVFHNKTKHIDVKYHYCREMINESIVSVDYLCTSDMPAHLLTKSLGAVKHYKRLNALEIVKV
ncbi:unnamed protein product [Euphydryas editha]|uniref:Copia protein n=1 Tax=Euphydryas editha TaxID=104508 RepID=A0AAU9VCP6_EUPED|nr:unnamed protein product [Euphydryas editha]